MVEKCQNDLRERVAYVTPAAAKAKLSHPLTQVVLTNYVA